MAESLLSSIPKQLWQLCQNHRKKLSAVYLGVIISVNIYSGPVAAQTVLEQIRQGGILTLGIREDAIPFGYRDNQGHLRGLCIDFFKLLKEKIVAELEENIISVKLVESTVSNRFRLVEDNIVYLECGPNTIRDDLEYQVTFSQSFFTTGTQFLVKKTRENIGDLEFNTEFSIGVLRNTTTEAYLREEYPEANIVLFQGETARKRGVEAVIQERIAAMASDGILLLGEAVVLGIPFNENYDLVPKKPITCDYYGMIIPKNDPEWEALVNSVVAEFEKTDGDWFEEVDNYLEEIERYCSPETNK